MTASPIARLVVAIIGIVVIIVAGGAVYGDLTGRSLSSETLLLGSTGIGIIGGVLAKTTFDKPADEPTEVTIADQLHPVVTEDAADV